jgi:hypothetical protein
MLYRRARLWFLACLSGEPCDQMVARRTSTAVRSNLDEDSIDLASSNVTAHFDRFVTVMSLKAIKVAHFQGECVVESSRTRSVPSTAPKTCWMPFFGLLVLQAWSN